MIIVHHRHDLVQYAVVGWKPDPDSAARMRSVPRQAMVKHASLDHCSLSPTSPSLSLCLFFPWCLCVEISACVVCLSGVVGWEKVRKFVEKCFCTNFPHLMKWCRRALAVQKLISSLAVNQIDSQPLNFEIDFLSNWQFIFKAKLYFMFLGWLPWVLKTETIAHSHSYQSQS